MIKKDCLKKIILIFFILGSMIGTTCNASDVIENPDLIRPGRIEAGDTQIITEKVNAIIGTIVTAGVVISVITLLVLGIKYMIGSVEEKAEYKKSMIPYIIGAILLFASSSIVGLIADIVTNVKFS